MSPNQEERQAEQDEEAQHTLQENSEPYNPNPNPNPNLNRDPSPNPDPNPNP